MSLFLSLYFEKFAQPNCITCHFKIDKNDVCAGMFCQWFFHNSKKIYKGGYSASKTTLFVYVCHVFFYSRILLLHRTTSISNSSHTYLGNYRSYRSQYLHVSNRRQILQYLLQLANFRHRHHVTSLRFLDLMHVSAKCLKYQLYYEIYLCKCIYLIRWVFQFLETLLRSENIYSSHIPRSFLEIFFNR